MYAADTGEFADDSVGAHATMKAAYRVSTVSPFVGFGLGVDVISGNPSLATFMTAGLELVVHRRLALVLEGHLHKGFGAEFTIVHELASFGFGIEVRF